MSQNPKSTPRTKQQVSSLPGFTLPHSSDLEDLVLGTILYYNTNETRYALTFLDEMDFFQEKNTIIFKAIRSLYIKGDDIDSYTVVEELNKLSLLELAGGPYGVMTLLNNVNSVSNIGTHIRILKQKSLQRKLIQLCDNRLKDAHDPTKDIFELIDETMFELTKMSDTISKSDSTISANQVITSFMQEVNDESEEIRYIWETGHKQFDSKVGFTRDKIILLAGGAKHGKSKFNMSLMFMLLERYAEELGIYWVSLEDSAKDIAANYLASKLFIKPKEIKRRNYSAETRSFIGKWLDKFNSFDITFQEQSAKSWKIVNDFKNFCKLRKNKLNILIIDNILALSDREDFKGAENSMYDYIMNQMLNCRQQTKACIILIHHYKDSQQEESKIKAAFRPRLTDMKGTEAFRRIPNSVMLINNPGKYDDLMTEYGDNRDALRNLYIVDTGANREDTSDDDSALIRFVHSLDFNIFIEI